MSNARLTENDGHVAIVTGAAGGIGRATCARLADGGAKVVAVDLLPDRLAALDAQRCAGGAAAVEGGASAAAAGDLSAYVRRRLDEAEAGTIEFADGAARARGVCERQYRALK